MPFHLRYGEPDWNERPHSVSGSVSDIQQRPLSNKSYEELRFEASQKKWAFQFVDLNTMAVSSGADATFVNLKNLTDVVEIVVGKADSDEPARWIVHQKLLTDDSEFASLALKHNFKEKDERVIRFPEEHPDVFEHYIKWLYTSCILTFSLELVVQMYTLGDRLQSIKFANACYETVSRSTDSYTAHQIKYIFDHTYTDDRLRKLCVSQVGKGILAGRYSFSFSHEQELLKEFMPELMQGVTAAVAEMRMGSNKWYPKIAGIDNTSNTTRPSIFDQTTSNPPGGNLFAPRSGVSLFGNNNGPRASAGPGLFGVQQSNGVSGSTILFGNNNSQTPTSVRLFGGWSSGAPKSGGLFGTNSAVAGGGLFGTNPALAGAHHPGTNSAVAGGGLFGTNPSSSGGGLFGTRMANTGGGPFTTSAPTANPGVGLFGTGTDSAGNTGLFGVQQPNSGTVLGPASNPPVSGRSTVGGQFGGFGTASNPPVSRRSTGGVLFGAFGSSSLYGATAVNNAASGTTNTSAPSQASTGRTTTTAAQSSLFGNVSAASPFATAPAPSGAPVFSLPPPPQPAQTQSEYQKGHPPTPFLSTLSDPKLRTGRNDMPGSHVPFSYNTNEDTKKAHRDMEAWRTSAVNPPKRPFSFDQPAPFGLNRGEASASNEQPNDTAGVPDSEGNGAPSNDDQNIDDAGNRKDPASTDEQLSGALMTMAIPDTRSETGTGFDAFLKNNGGGKITEYDQLTPEFQQTLASARETSEKDKGNGNGKETVSQAVEKAETSTNTVGSRAHENNGPDDLAPASFSMGDEYIVSIIAADLRKDSEASTSGKGQSAAGGALGAIRQEVATNIAEANEEQERKMKEAKETLNRFGARIL
jgi:Nucleoporin FG repeat region